LHRSDLQDGLRAEAAAMLTRDDITAGKARIEQSGGIPGTFVIGPKFDSNWLVLNWHVSGYFDGQHLIGSGKTMDAAVADLVEKANTPSNEPKQLSLLEVAA
jgi:hypothetical protein